MPISQTHTSRELISSRDGLKIYGQLFLPQGAEETVPLPTLVCAHGFGDNYLKTVAYAWEMAEHGWASLCFDFCGGGYASRSDGNPLEMTLTTECADIAAVVETLLEETVVDGDRLCLLGEGLGGLAATLYSHDHPDVARSMVLIQPTFNLYEQTRRLFPTKKNIPASYRHLGMRVGRSFGEVLMDTNPYAMMAAYAGDVLIVSGTDDTTVPTESLRRACAAFPSAELVLLPGGRTALRGDGQRRALSQVRTFLEASVGDQS